GPDLDVPVRLLPQVGPVEARRAPDEVAGVLVGVDEVAAASGVGYPAVGCPPGSPQLHQAVLHVPIAAVRFLDRLRQARVGHPVEDVPDALRVILVENSEDLLVELLDLGSSPPGALYRAGTIKAHAALRALA